MEFEEEAPENNEILDPGALDLNDKSVMRENHIQVSNMGEKYKVITYWYIASVFVYSFNVLMQQKI